jgi:hypothetical protein
VQHVTVDVENINSSKKNLNRLHTKYYTGELISAKYNHILEIIADKYHFTCMVGICYNCKLMAERNKCETEDSNVCHMLNIGYISKMYEPCVNMQIWG